MKKGALDQSTNDVKLEESAVIVRLMIGEQYKISSSARKSEERRQAGSLPRYTRRQYQSSGQDPCQIITGPQSQISLRWPGLAYLMRTQNWPIDDVQTDGTERTRKDHVRVWWKIIYWGQRRCCTLREKKGR